MAATDAIIIAFDNDDDHDDSYNRKGRDDNDDAKSRLQRMFLQLLRRVTMSLLHLHSEVTIRTMMMMIMMVILT